MSVNVCVDPSILHSVSFGWNQNLETESSDPLFSHVSCGGNQPLETEFRQREREDREKGSGSVISMEESNSRKSRRNDTRNKSVYSHQTLHDIEERDHLREHIERRALQATLGEIFAQRKLYSTEYDMEITDLEIQNMHCMSHSVSLNPRKDICNKQVNGQTRLIEKEYACVANWSERIVFIERAIQEVAKKLKSGKDAAIKKKMK